MSAMVRGVSYQVSHPMAVVRQVMATIREDLHASSVMVIGTEAESLVASARIALEEELEVLVRPHVEDGRLAELTRHLREVARGAEQLRREFPGKVTLLLGTEFSMTSRTVLPGFVSFVRLYLILVLGPLLTRRIRKRLGRVLDALLAVTREEFGGPVTYAAGTWEPVDWSAFDVVGVNLYRSGNDPVGYRDLLRAHVSAAHGADKPFFVTEFGCGAFTGAERRGAGSFQIVNWFTDPPRVRGDHPRDEGTQAAYLTELIELYGDNDVDGCFVFTFSMPEFPRGPEPELDLDRAGFGLVAVRPDDPDTWERKEAFHAVAHAFAARS